MNRKQLIEELNKIDGFNAFMDVDEVWIKTDICNYVYGVGGELFAQSPITGSGCTISAYCLKPEIVLTIVKALTETTKE